MKRSTYFLLLLVISSSIAIILMYDSSVKRELSALQRKIMQLHSEVSPKVDGMTDLRSSLKERIQTLKTQGSHKEEIVARYATTVKELEDIKQDIQTWRAKITPTRWQQQDTKEAIKLLKGAKQEIEEISERVEEVIEQIEDILQEEQE